MNANANNGTVVSPIIPAFMVSWVQLLVPGECFDEFFIEFNFLHVPCLKVVVSKALGYAIILGALGVKLPQLMKIWNAQTGEGISISALVFEMVAICSAVIYSARHQFPFTSYGDGVFLAIQTILIGMMVLYFSNKILHAALFLLSFCLGCSFFMSSLVPLSSLALLQTGNIFLIIISKLMQAITNIRCGNTGQLSVITVFLIMLGSTARIFTSLQETGDHLIITSYVVATLFNVLIAFQMVYYWNVPVGPTKTAGDKEMKEKKKN